MTKLNHLSLPELLSTAKAEDHPTNLSVALDPIKELEFNPIVRTPGNVLQV